MTEQRPNYFALVVAGFVCLLFLGGFVAAIVDGIARWQREDREERSLQEKALHMKMPHTAALCAYAAQAFFFPHAPRYHEARRLACEGEDRAHCRSMQRTDSEESNTYARALNQELQQTRAQEHAACVTFVARYGKAFDTGRAKGLVKPDTFPKLLDGPVWKSQCKNLSEAEACRIYGMQLVVGVTDPRW